MHKADTSCSGLSLHLTLSVTHGTEVVAEVIAGDGSDGVGAPYFTDKGLLVFVPEIGGLGIALRNASTACQSHTAALHNLNINITTTKQINRTSERTLYMCFLYKRKEPLLLNSSF